LALKNQRFFLKSSLFLIFLADEMDDGEAEEYKEIFHCQEGLCNSTPYPGAAAVAKISNILFGVNFVILLLKFL